VDGPCGKQAMQNERRFELDNYWNQRSWVIYLRDVICPSASYLEYSSSTFPSFWNRHV
jgi:hypothetical protein